uniref:Phosphatidylinositol-specific phospholipase C X domain-containing protein n=1 Tax=Mola mola TaxID=94237 RepID=A0A3Q3W387_MOLML
MAMSALKSRKRREVTSYSDWMSQLPAELHSIHLFKLIIPGSHDSMSYDLDVNSSIIEPERLKRFSKFCCVRKMVRKWAMTQVNATITNQLDAGVRYFDLRIARKRNDVNPTRLYFYHGLYTRTDVEVKKEMSEITPKILHPKEILILALSHFKGFDRKIEKDLHKHLINFTKTLFGAKLFLRTVKIYPEIWSKIPYYYGNSMNPLEVQSKLRYYLENRVRPSKGEWSRCFFVCGLNLTLPDNARILKYILRLCDNFPNVIHRSLPRILQWVKQQAGKIPMNIIASDIATRDQFVPTIVKLNTSKGAMHEA